MFWYYKPTPTALNGQIVDVIQEAGDIISLAPSVTPPENYIFFGEYEPVYVWWVQTESDDSYWIFSPIQPANGWETLGSIPVCSLCNTYTIGTIEILVANASGIYTFVLDADHDELIQRNSFDSISGVLDVPIPEPFVRTAFVP